MILPFLRIKTIVTVIFAFCLTSLVSSQEKYWVFFKDKKGCSLDAYSYFDPKAIDRKVKLGLPLVSETDLPLNNTYLNEIEKICGRVYTKSRWLNAVTVAVPSDQLGEITKLDFIRDIQPVTLFENNVVCSFGEEELSSSNLNLLEKQISRMGADEFEKRGINGKGVRIAVFDAGFPGVNTNPCFEHLIKDGRIIKTYDFVKNREDVFTSNAHGTMVLSCIAGIYNNHRMGLATGAEFLLARTEQKSEPFSEEENWLAALEWADKNGADIISSSLGYTYHRYFPGQMDGKTSLVVKAAGIAARKGILVVNAMGNDGDKSWEFLSTPADADSIISVGGINPDTDYHISFSSYGPTADMRRKPNVSAYGKVIAAKVSGVGKVEGTSFSTPLVAGFAACVMQLDSGYDNMKIFKLIEQSGHLYPYYDYAHGYGIPQAGFFFSDSLPEQQNICFSHSEDSISIGIPDSITLDNDSSGNLLFYHIENESGVLEKYAVVKVYQNRVLALPLNEALKNKTLRAHFRGTTIEYKITSK